MGGGQQAASNPLAPFTRFVGRGTFPRTVPCALAGTDGLTDLSNECAAFPTGSDADMMAPGSRGGDIPPRGGYHRRDSP